MKEETYKLNDAGTHIVQQPEMKEPVYDLSAQMSKIYKEHIASLKTIPISGIVPERWKGKELVEGRDFSIYKGKNLGSVMVISLTQYLFNNQNG